MDGWVGLGLGWDLCVGQLYEFCFAMLIKWIEVGETSYAENKNAA